VPEVRVLLAGRAVLDVSARVRLHGEAVMYVYVKSEDELWTGGFYDPDGKWQPESDHGNRDSAASRVAWLNGSVDPVATAQAILNARVTVGPRTERWFQRVGHSPT
jgi:hypothetical protein